MSNLSDIKVVVDPNNLLSARVGTQDAIRVVSSVSKEIPTQNFLKDLDDIDIPDPVSDGSVLVYNASTMKWEAVDELNGGSY